MTSKGDFTQGIDPAVDAASGDIDRISGPNNCELEVGRAPSGVESRSTEKSAALNEVNGSEIGEDLSPSPERRVLPTWVLLLGLMVSLVILGTAWSLASPVGASPDDDFHLASIWCSGTAPSDQCLPTTNSQPAGLRSVLVPVQISPAALCFPFNSAVAANCGINTDDDRLVESRANDGLYPGGYYALMGVLVTNDPVEAALTMRLAAWSLAFACIVGAAAVAERRIRSAYVLAVLATVVPLGLFLFASNNPSGLAIAGVGAFWCSSLTFMSSHDHKRMRWSAAVATLSGGLALVSRADAGLYIGAVSVSLWVFVGGWERGLWKRSALLASAALISLVGLLSGSQVSGAADGLADTATVRALSSTLWYNLNNLPSLWTGSLGTWGLGWLDTTMPAVVWTGMLLIAGGLTFWALGMRRKLRHILALAIMTLTVVIVPLIILSGSGNLVGENVQPRYLLPALPILLGYLLLAAPGGAVCSLNWTQRVAVVLVTVIAQSAALHANLRRYVTGQDVLSPNLDDTEWWWPISLSPMSVWIVGSAAFGAAVLTAIALTSNASGWKADKRQARNNG